MKNFLAVIPAREGSLGLKGKNFLKFFATMSEYKFIFPNIYIIMSLVIVILEVGSSKRYLIKFTINK